MNDVGLSKVKSIGKLEILYENFIFHIIMVTIIPRFVELAILTMVQHGCLTTSIRCYLLTKNMYFTLYLKRQCTYSNIHIV